MAPARTAATPADPYPPNRHFRIVDVRYVDHLQIARYAARPKGSPIGSDWQLSEDYRLDIDIDYLADDGDIQYETWHLSAPRGMYTDLSSVPGPGRWIVSKVGPHLEASIIHDYLYLKWTDDRLNNARCSDWIFADAVLRAGMARLGDFSWFQRFAVNFATGAVGWFVFRRKTERFADQVARWTPDLGYLPHDPIPPADQSPPQPPSVWTSVYMTIAFLVFVAIVLMGAGKLFGWLGLAGWMAAIAPLAAIAEGFLAATISLVGVVLVVGLVGYAVIRLYIKLTTKI